MGAGTDSTATSRDLDAATWRYVVRRSWHGFVRHRGIDAAAALTFFGALSLFPSSLLVVSLLSLAEGRERAARELLAIVSELAHESAVEAVTGPLQQLASIRSPALAAIVAFVFTLWTVSAYATAFGRAMNEVYEVLEGRQFWVFRGLMLLVTLLLVVCGAAVTAILLLTPGVSASIAEAAGLPEWMLHSWNVGKWPALAVLAALLAGSLYYFTPNVRHIRFRWVSYGAGFAIIAWGLATLGFAGYVLSIGRYDRVYGWLGGAVVLLLWLYLTNLVLVLGAELDAEIVRARQLAAGVEAEQTIQLPARDTARTLMLARQRADDEAQGRAIRERAGE